MLKAFGTFVRQNLFMNKKISFVKSDVAKRIDEALFNEYSFSLEQLMELAGFSCSLSIYDAFPVRLNPSVLVVCGPGNNGGDGLVCARHLKIFGYTSTIFYPNKTPKKPFYTSLISQAKHFDIPFKSNIEDMKFQSYDLVVDALFGFGFNGIVKSPYDVLISNMIKAHPNICSIDVPSGWSVDEVDQSNLSEKIAPKMIISLSVPKICVESFKGFHYLGGRFLPEKLIKDFNLVIPAYEGKDQITKLF